MQKTMEECGKQRRNAENKGGMQKTMGNAENGRENYEK